MRKLKKLKVFIKQVVADCEAMNKTILKMEADIVELKRMEQGK